MTSGECHDYLNNAQTWQEYGERYTYLSKSVPTELKKAGSWAQIESFPHLMFQLMHCYKWLWWRDKRGFIFK